MSHLHHRCRTIYVIGDAPRGQWSQPAEVTVRGWWRLERGLGDRHVLAA